MIEAAVFCLAMNIYHESRNQSTEGQNMVALVTMNRAGWDNQQVCHVVAAPHQFSWTIGKTVKTSFGYAVHNSAYPHEAVAWFRSLRIARATIRAGKLTWNLDISKGATFYHTKYIKRPYWARKMKVVTVVGDHIFYQRA